MHNLFIQKENKNPFKPLAEKMRPTNLDEFVGQEELLGKKSPLRKMIQTDNISSMIFWGPPGVGKTTLAKIIANSTSSIFKQISAVTSGVKELKEIVNDAIYNKNSGNKTILFVDEIHRFNKSQQDAFLPYVETGDIILIGATTENPSFEVNAALLSRTKVYVLKSLSTEDIVKLLKRAITAENGLKDKNVVIDNSCLYKIANLSNGDARNALNTLENAVSITPIKGNKVTITDDILEKTMQKKMFLYDKKGEEHYNLISALHKSMRNSDPDAALYYLARMLEAGEDPLYVARRLVRFASEDIGLANPNALVQAIAAYDASHYIGMSECTVNLAQAVVYLSVSPKSNSLYQAYKGAAKDALDTANEKVPLNLRNATTKLNSQLGYGKGYKYAHDFEGKPTNMQCLPDNLVGRKYYKPSNQGNEAKIKEYLTGIEKTKKG